MIQVNGLGIDDSNMPGMKELHRKVSKRYGWVMHREDPQW